MRMRLALGVAVVLLSSILALADDASRPLRILFMHHSTGGDLLRDGGVREGLAALGYEVWDHGYNDEGLFDARGDAAGVSFDVPDDNTNPDGWANVFAQEPTSPPDNAFSRMLEYDVILFKSCFPASNITDDEMFANYKAWYLQIRDAVDRHPDRLFIAFTPPPLVPNETDEANAARAQAWARFLTSDDFVGDRTHLAVFDFHSLLADEKGMLRVAYRGGEWDSHPNESARRTVGPLLVQFVAAAIARWQAGP